MPNPPVNEEPSTLTEIREAIFKLKGGKAEVICGILAKLLNAGGEPVALDLPVVLAVIWYHSPDLLMGVAISL